MAGAYCKFCQTRCFVDRVIPGGPLKGRSFHLATCARGMEHDLRATGFTHETAINPITDPDAAARVAAEVREEQTAKRCNCLIGGGDVVPACCQVHGVPCESCGGLSECKPGCGETNGAETAS